MPCATVNATAMLMAKENAARGARRPYIAGTVNETCAALRGMATMTQVRLKARSFVY